MNTKEIIEEAGALPVEERVRIVDSLLQSLNKPETEIEKKWTSVARSRMQELRNGSVEAVAGREVFERIWKRFYE